MAGYTFEVALPTTGRVTGVVLADPSPSDRAPLAVLSYQRETRLGVSYAS